jgi:5-methyltetrahydrofolate--homocysteine methyltransferase
VAVGGAVLTAEYAEKIGADFYAKDAMELVRLASRLLDGSPARPNAANRR